MSIPEYDIKEQWLGTGDTTAYTFDFTIQQANFLLIIIQDSNGNQLYKVRGDDTTILSGIIFDSVNGGGTVTLINVLGNNYVITMLLAPDYPTQPSEFKNKFSFNLFNFELALDYLMGPIQRLAYLARRSFKLDDLDDITLFNPTLPPGIAAAAGAAITVSNDGTGLAYGATMGQIANAVTYAADALASQEAAAVSAAAALASAIAAAASAIAAQSGFGITGTRAGPLGITAAGGITFTGENRQLTFVHGSPGAVILTANPQINAGVAVGNELTIMGCDDTNTLKIVDGNGTDMNGDCILGNGDVLGLVWDGALWTEIYRRSAT